MPPITTSGSISDTYQTFVQGDQKRRTSNMVTGDLHVSTYIWQPWFVTTAGGVVFSQISRNDESGDGEVIGGDARINILPVSHIPTTVAYNKTDSRLEGGAGADYSTERLSATQSTFFQSGLKVITTASRELIDGFENGEEEIDIVGVAATKSFGKHQLTLDARHTSNSFQAAAPPDQDEEEVLDRVVLNHSYAPSANFRLNNTINLTRDQEDKGGQLRDHVTMQGISTQSWRSSTSPLTVTGALRIQREEEDIDGLLSEDSERWSNLVSGALGLNYRFTPGLSGNLGLSGSYIDTERVTTGIIPPVVTLQETKREAEAVGGIRYLSPPKQLGEYTWRWNGRGNARLKHRNEETGISEEEDRTDMLGDVSLGHRVSRPIHVPLFGLGRFSLGQSVETRATSEEEAEEEFTPKIVHDAEVSYSARNGGAWTSLRIWLKDERDLLIDEPLESQFLTLRLDRRSAVDARRDWSAAISAQASRRKMKGEDADFAASALGYLSYTDRSFLDISNMYFSSILELNLAGLEDVIRKEDSRNRFEEERRADWTNKIEYRIGRLTMSVEGKLFYVGDEFGNAVIARIRRDFGGVF